MLMADIDALDRALAESTARERSLQAQCEASHQLISEQQQLLQAAALERREAELTCSRGHVRASSLACTKEALRRENKQLRAALAAAEQRARASHDDSISKEVRGAMHAGRWRRGCCASAYGGEMWP